MRNREQRAPKGFVYLRNGRKLLEMDQSRVFEKQGVNRSKGTRVFEKPGARSSKGTRVFEEQRANSSKRDYLRNMEQTARR